MGQPRRQKPPLVTGISDGRVECEESHWLGTTRRDLDLLRWRPREGPRLSQLCPVQPRDPPGGPPGFHRRGTRHSKRGREPRP